MKNNNYPDNRKGGLRIFLKSAILRKKHSSHMELALHMAAKNANEEHLSHDRGSHYAVLHPITFFTHLQGVIVLSMADDMLFFVFFFFGYSH